MIFKDVQPTVPLGQMVQYYRLRHFIIPQNLPISAKPFPARPEQCIAFYPRGFEIREIIPDKIRILNPRSVISGQYTKRINRISSPAEFFMIQVVFKPGALHRLTGIPSNELLNLHIDLEAVYPEEGRLVNERLNSCGNYTEMITIIEDFLLSLVRKIKIESRPADEIFNLILSDHQKYSLDWLAKQACLSPRQFERKSDQYLGVSPKLFARISRFNQSYNMRLKEPKLDWLSIAVACGYHDYQHLVRDYKEFADTTPNLLFDDEKKVLERSLGLNK